MEGFDGLVKSTRQTWMWNTLSVGNSTFSLIVLQGSPRFQRRGLVQLKSCWFLDLARYWAFLAHSFRIILCAIKSKGSVEIAKVSDQASGTNLQRQDKICSWGIRQVLEKTIEVLSFLWKLDISSSHSLYILPLLIYKWICHSRFVADSSLSFRDSIGGVCAGSIFL